jgi:hypothetical protein
MEPAALITESSKPIVDTPEKKKYRMPAHIIALKAPRAGFANQPLPP